MKPGTRAIGVRLRIVLELNIAFGRRDAHARTMICRRRLLGPTLAALLLAPSVAAVATSDVPTVAAASDLRFALEEVAAHFRQDTGREIEPIFGSSGNFARQIAQGAPFEMFMSADQQYVLALADQGLTFDRGELYAIGRIVLFAPHGSPLVPDAAMDDLGAAISDGRIERFAIANPEHAPYGRAAEQALRARDLWEAIRPALVLGENVSQAAQFAASGSVQGGIFAYSLALAPNVGELGTFALLPESWHEPLRQRMVLLEGAGETAQAFYRFVQEPAARAIFRRYGFVPPQEGS